MVEEAVDLAKPGAPVEEISRLAERLFREESGKLVATLTRHFGVDHLQLAEDVVQEALARALRVWPFYGVPKNPAAWLTQTAKNLALDVVRRQKSFADKEAAIIASIEHTGTDLGAGETVFDENEIRDDRLRMLFVCCHPHLAQEAQVALALKTLCGFNTVEISKAFLTTEASIAKRLTRAKQRLRDDAIPFEIPSGPELSARLEAVLQTLYLLFNEGYKASGGDRLVREELCFEAIRLMTFLVEHPAGDLPRVHALLALMLFNAARLASRVDAEGNLLRLEEQNRAKWNAELIARGMQHLSRSAVGNALSEYHLQAGIAACHCAARDYASTDWLRILALYDRLVELDASPVIALNRAIAVANVHGPATGIAAVSAIRDREKLESYYLLYAVLGDFEVRLGRRAAAAEHFQRALELADTKSEQAFLEKRLRDCRA
ncbi:MAG TPA: sigma-70 family RNA polymerase sigma factor [Chthoniobacteraceae bacterium]|jgi:RNA polymerase sigma-70 factor (ECF subfamily)|nr:sigma-70 family RNA polymerase sigma factor [Chthoniobacteraceae bacterium]